MMDSWDVENVKHVPGGGALELPEAAPQTAEQQAEAARASQRHIAKNVARGPVKLSHLTAMRNNMGDSWDSNGSGVRRVPACL
jgi:hypothetical protein